MTQELRQRAVRLLARREHTRAELARKLAPHGSEEDINIVLAELQASRLQSDARFAENYVRANAERLGASRLRHNLRIKGVASELIDAYKGQMGLPRDQEVTMKRKATNKQLQGSQTIEGSGIQDNETLLVEMAYTAGRATATTRRGAA